MAQPGGLGFHQLLGWGIAFLDVDEDGRKDLIIANGHVYPEVGRIQSGETYAQQTLVYRNLGNARFADITAQAGPAFKQSRPARGMAVGDLDGDGLPEIVIVNMNQTPSLLKNTGPHQNFISILLTGTKSNRSAIGARVSIEAAGRRQVDEVMSGSSFFSQNDLALFFGLGKAEMDWRAVLLYHPVPASSESPWPGRPAPGSSPATIRSSRSTTTCGP